MEEAVKLELMNCSFDFDGEKLLTHSTVVVTVEDT